MASWAFAIGGKWGVMIAIMMNGLMTLRNGDLGFAVTLKQVSGRGFCRLTAADHSNVSLPVEVEKQLIRLQSYMVSKWVWHFDLLLTHTLSYILWLWLTDWIHSSLPICRDIMKTLEHGVSNFLIHISCQWKNNNGIDYALDWAMLLFDFFVRSLPSGPTVPIQWHYYHFQRCEWGFVSTTILSLMDDSSKWCCQLQCVYFFGDVLSTYPIPSTLWYLKAVRFQSVGCAVLAGFAKVFVVFCP